MSSIHPNPYNWQLVTDEYFVTAIYNGFFILVYLPQVSRLLTFFISYGIKK